MNSASNCVKCGAPLVADPGHQKLYCSIACRRSAEHEIRRLNVLLGKLELHASNARLGCCSEPAKRLKALETEIELNEARMRVLLKGNEND